jgi:hypothetical protein
MRDNARVVQTTQGPVAYVTTVTGHVRHLRDLDAVAEFVDGREDRFPTLLADYRAAMVASGQRPPERPLVTVDEALRLVRAFQEREGAA